MKKYVLMIIIAAIVGLVGFYVGIQYNKSSASPVVSQNFRAGRSGQANGGFLSGVVTAKDNQSLTLQTRDNSSHLVFYGTSTSVIKPSPASINDVNTGASVTVIGSQNSDGSLNAQTIQIRPTQGQ